MDMESKAELKRRLFSSLVYIGFLCAPLAAQSARGPQEGSEVKVDYTSTRREIQSFEGVINEVIHATFTSPFALNQKAKGVYLPGFGVSFNFLVNIHRALINTPFGDIKSRDAITPEQKKRRIEDLKKRLIKVLLDDGRNLRQLRQDDSIAIVAFIEDRNFPDEPNENKTIVLSVTKRDLGDTTARDERAVQNFEQKVKILEY
jgi:hypothetical protein